MMNTRKRLLVGLVVTVGALLLGASMAWACSPQSHISVTPDNAPPGGEITVNGEGFIPSHQIVVRWDSREGEELGRGLGPEFHIDVTVPANAEPGTHVVWAVDANDRWAARRTVHVSDPNASTSPGASGAASGGEHSNANSSGQTSASTSGGDASASTGSRDGSQQGSSSRGSGSSQQGSGSSDSSLRGPDYGQGSALSGPNYNDAPQSAPQGSSAPEGAASSQPASSSQAVGESGRTPSTGGQTASQSVGQPTDDRAGAPQPAGGRSASQADDGRARQAQPSPDEPAGSHRGRGGNDAASAEEAAQDRDGRQAAGGDRAGRAGTDAATSSRAPSARTGAGDLWSGFDAGDGQASLATGVEGSPAHAGDDTAQPLALALGLVGAGLLVLMSGAFVGVARRRALATTSTRPQRRG